MNGNSVVLDTLVEFTSGGGSSNTNVASTFDPLTFGIISALIIAALAIAGFAIFARKKALNAGINAKSSTNLKIQNKKFLAIIIAVIAALAISASTIGINRAIADESQFASISEKITANVDDAGNVTFNKGVIKNNGEILAIGVRQVQSTTTVDLSDAKLIITCQDTELFNKTLGQTQLNDNYVTVPVGATADLNYTVQMPAEKAKQLVGTEPAKLTTTIDVVCKAKGTLIDDDGKTLADATIQYSYVDPYTGKTVTGTTTSDSKGQYSLPDIIKDTKVEIVATKDGYTTTFEYTTEEDETIPQQMISKFAIAPTVITGLKWTGETQLGVSGGANITLGGTYQAIEPGDYTATATPKAGFEWKTEGGTTPKSINWSIAKADNPHPEGPSSQTVKAVDETVKGKNDGKITGVDSTMEYQASGATDWTAVPTGKTEIALDPGTYKVRYAGDDHHEPSPALTLTINKSTTGLKVTASVDETGHGTITGSPVSDITYDTAYTIDNDNKKITIGSGATAKEITYTKADTWDFVKWMLGTAEATSGTVQEDLAFTASTEEVKDYTGTVTTPVQNSTTGKYEDKGLSGASVVFTPTTGTATETTTDSDGVYTLDGVEVGTEGTITVTKASGGSGGSDFGYTTDKFDVDKTKAEQQQSYIGKIKSLSVEVYDSDKGAKKATYWCPAFKDADVNMSNIQFFNKNNSKIELIQGTASENTAYKMSDLTDLNASEKTADNVMLAKYYAICKAGQTLHCYQTADAKWNDVFEITDESSKQEGDYPIVANKLLDNFDMGTYCSDTSAKTIYFDGSSDSDTWKDKNEVIKESATKPPTINGVNYSKDKQQGSSQVNGWYETYGGSNGGVLSWVSDYPWSVVAKNEQKAFFWDSSKWNFDPRNNYGSVVLAQSFSTESFEVKTDIDDKTHGSVAPEKLSKLITSGTSYTVNGDTITFNTGEATQPTITYTQDTAKLYKRTKWQVSNDGGKTWIDLDDHGTGAVNVATTFRAVTKQREMYSGNVLLKSEDKPEGDPLSGATVVFKQDDTVKESVSTSSTAGEEGTFKFSNVLEGEEGTVEVTYAPAKSDEETVVYSKDVYTTTSSTSAALPDFEIRKLTSLQVMIFQHDKNDKPGQRKTFWCPAFKDNEFKNSEIKFYKEDGTEIIPADTSSDHYYKMTDLYDSINKKMLAYSFAFLAKNKTLNCYQTTDASWNEAFDDGTFSSGGTATKFIDAFSTAKWTPAGQGEQSCPRVANINSKEVSITPQGGYWLCAQDTPNWQPSGTGASPAPTLNTSVNYSDWYSVYGRRDGGVLSYYSVWPESVVADNDAFEFIWDSDKWSTQYRFASRGIVLAQSFTNIPESYSGNVKLKNETSATNLENASVNFKNDTLDKTVTTDANGNFKLDGVQEGTAGTITVSYAPSSSTDVYSKDKYTTTALTKSTDLPNFEIRKLTSLSVTVKSDNTTEDLTTSWLPAFADGGLTKSTIKFYDSEKCEVNGSATSGSTDDYKMSDLFNSLISKSDKTLYFAFTATNQTLKCYQTTDVKWNAAFAIDAESEPYPKTATGLVDNFISNYCSDTNAKTIYFDGTETEKSQWAPLNVTPSEIPTLNDINYNTWWTSYKDEGSVITSFSSLPTSAVVSSKYFNYAFRTTSTSWETSIRSLINTSVVLSRSFSNSSQQEIKLIEGEFIADEWGNQPGILSDGGSELIAAGAEVGDNLVFYCERYPLGSETWDLQIWDGHWYLQYNDLSNKKYDLEGNDGKIVLKLTEDIFKNATTVAGWGNAFLLNGDNIKCTKVSLVKQ